MKILFVSSGNNKTGISAVVKAQGESLVKSKIQSESKIDVDYFTIVGRGVYGYLKNIIRLRKYLRNRKFDLIHSHFFLSSVVATLSNPKYLVVSLMGSDAYTSNIWNFLIKLFHNRWDTTIVKSEKMKAILGLDDLYVIPNGVDFEKFYPIDRQTAREKLGWNKKRYVLFASSPNRPEKNYQLASEAVGGLNNNVVGDETVELVTLENIPHDKINYYLNAANVLLMTSNYEGSPNIIKEAMACNCPIVSTDVGDVGWVVGKTEGCLLISEKSLEGMASQNEQRETNDNERISETSEKLKEALEFSEQVGRTNGRERIIELGLDSETVAKKIISIYKKIVRTN